MVNNPDSTCRCREEGEKALYPEEAILDQLVDRGKKTVAKKRRGEKRREKEERKGEGKTEERM